MTDRPGYRRRVWFVVLVAVLTGIAVAWNGRADGAAMRYDKGEVHVYNMAAERMLQGVEIYRPADLKPFTYPPFMALWFVPIACLPHYAVRPVWYAVNFLMLSWVILLLFDLVRRFDPAPAAGGRRRWGFLILLAALAGRHVTSVFENQSNDMITLLLVTLGVHAWCLERPGRGGAMFAVGAASKATPLLFLPVLVWQRQIRGVVVMLAALLAATVVTELAFARQDGQLWISAWFQTFVAGIDAVGGNTDKVGNAWAAWNIRNQNLASLVYRFSTPVEPFWNHTFDVSLWHLQGAALRYATFAAQLAVLGLIAWALRPVGGEESAAQRIHRRLAEGAVVACGMVLLSPMSSKSHFCVLLLPILVCCYDYVFRRRTVLMTVCLLVLSAVALTAKGLLGLEMGYQVLARGSVTWGTLAAMIGTVAVLERDRRAGTAAG